PARNRVGLASARRRSPQALAATLAAGLAGAALVERPAWVHFCSRSTASHFSSTLALPAVAAVASPHAVDLGSPSFFCLASAAHALGEAWKLAMPSLARAETSWLGM